MILTSIRIRNFRAIREVVFQPLTDGITGIFGSNGAGKTTFLSATLWALYGIRPPGGGVSSLRREGSGNQECSVSVVFSHLGQQIEVVRELRGKQNTALVTIWVDGVETTVASVGAANQWIIDRLGVDATGFTTAFVVRQKELDILITARAAERKALIERLAGIETINMALESARKKENEGKRLLVTFPGSEQTVTEADTQVNFYTDQLEQLSTNRESFERDYNTRAQRADAIQGQLNETQAIELRLAKEAAGLSALEGEETSLIERIKSVSYVLELPETADTLGELRQKHTTTKLAAQNESNDLNNARVTLQSLRGATDQNLTRKETIQRQLVSLTPRATPVTELEAEQSALQAESELLRNRIAGLRTRIGDRELSIQVLAGHDAECPTCGTHLDDPSATIERQRVEISEYEAEIATATTRNHEIADALRKLINDVQVITEHAGATAELSDLDLRLSDLAEQTAQAQALIVSKEQSLQTLNTQLEEITALGIKARNLDADRSTLTRSQERLAEVKTEIKLLRKSVNEQRKALGKHNLDEMRVEINRLRLQLEADRPKLSAVINDRGAVENKLIQARNALQEATRQWKRRKEMLREQERNAMVKEKLEKFRTDMISSLAPELSEHATSMISSMTNGEFVEVRLNDDFDATVVTAEGIERSVDWLSGGELSAVALALRIAIGFLITNGAPELLWLDEVLTAQDADRRASVLDLIRQLPIEQIIMINHTADAAEIVDKTVLLQKDNKNGSFIADPE